MQSLANTAGVHRTEPMLTALGMSIEEFSNIKGVIANDTQFYVIPQESPSFDFQRVQNLLTMNRAGDTSGLTYALEKNLALGATEIADIKDRVDRFVAVNSKCRELTQTIETMDRRETRCNQAAIGLSTTGVGGFLGSGGTAAVPTLVLLGAGTLFYGMGTLFKNEADSARTELAAIKDAYRAQLLHQAISAKSPHLDQTA